MAKVQVFHFTSNNGVPNNSALPVVVIEGAFSGVGADDICSRLEENGWTGTWTWSVFSYHHYHPNAHEALAVSAGAATLVLGGPGGKAVEVKAGDCLILPAGTGHKLEDDHGGFQVCGAYPPGLDQLETRRIEDGVADSVDRIARVPLPKTDPTTGGTGPLTERWSS
ncbi:cupin domain-containing protein [Palleronia abyssalis]|uniref:Cupin type-2 domain-containing protein n=1 Tax=Palleronia abyssalis TaxID=1501240 RepID=A0A2R8BWZ8_9RHOB|nr:cupin domain-containing protein [Palleronia abyssalis]SPJ24675.1 hypothetical protein PAA8504_02512 [Palleronia abyssalis]